MAQCFVGLTERHLKGLQRLSPEVIVELQKFSRQERFGVVLRVASAAEKSPQIAVGMNNLRFSVRPSHLVEIIDSLGDGVLEELGRHSFKISDDLGALVKNAGGAGKAYQILMQGGKLKGKNVAGLGLFLSSARAPHLKQNLLEIQKKFGKTFLTEIELFGVSRLSGEVHSVLDKAADAQLRRIAALAADSGDAAKGINRLTADLLAAKLNPSDLAGVLEKFGKGTLEQAERSGIRLSKELLDHVASLKGKTNFAKLDAFKTARILLEGFSAKGKTAAGLLDLIAEKIPSAQALRQTLDRIDSVEQQSALFSRWAMRNENVIQGITALKKIRPQDAREKVAGIYKNFGYQSGLSLLEEIGKLETKSASPKGLDRLAAELASTGADKAKGASLTLDYAVKTYPVKVTAFEGVMKGKGISEGVLKNIERHYDLIAGEISHEMKYWSSFEGKKLAQAADEFKRDFMLHFETSFRSLKWVFSKNIESNKTAIRYWMEDILLQPDIKKFLTAKKIDPAEASRRLLTALDPKSGWMLQFF